MQRMIKQVWITLAVLCVLNSCTKDSFIQSENALLLFSDDTIKFDTVFTSAGSVTKIVKIFNYNDQKLRLSRVHLYGGSNSAYTINLNGRSGTDFTDIDLEARDSIYLFAQVNINPTSGAMPFIVADSIGVEYNGKEEKIQLSAYGQNAHYLSAHTIHDDTVWHSELPVVLLGTVLIPEDKQLTIEKGTKVYCAAAAALKVNGSLVCNGDTAKADRIYFTGNRLDDGYNTLAGSWPGITFGNASRNNTLNYVSITNAVNAVVDTGDISLSSENIILNGCVIQNNSNCALWLSQSNLHAVNCLFANSTHLVNAEKGGTLLFEYCTIAGMGNSQVYHTSAAVTLSNTDASDNSYPLDAQFVNCIIWGGDGVSQELATTQRGDAAWKVWCENVMTKDLPSNVQVQNIISNTDPDFEVVNNVQQLYDFHLLDNSAAKRAGLPLADIIYDMEGLRRDASQPTIGCYE